MEAIGQLTGGIAHDFNNLLMVIAGGLEMIDVQADTGRRRRLMDAMHQAAQRGAALTRQLLAFSRRSDLKPEPIDLAVQIGGMRELLDRSLGGDVRVELEFAADLWPVEVDPGELELVVLNLAVNARDAMANGGTIVVRAENVADPVEGEAAGECVRLSVVDEGTGMSDEVKAHVFEPFYTTKEVGRGSGLGLAQVHGFARQSGGSVRIESTVGQGTTVSLLLPRSRRVPVRPEQYPVDHAGRSRQHDSGSVLLVEDDDEVAALVTDMLEELGYEVTRTASAAAALGALSNGRAIDLVFSDVMMPGGMNGVELARELRHRRQGLPILLTSGHAEAARASASAEGVRILPKPYRLDELASALATAITRH
jgi:CheY-like chemotaxis protein